MMRNIVGDSAVVLPKTPYLQLKVEGISSRMTDHNEK
jgi:hypothetical protein